MNESILFSRRNHFNILASILSLCDKKLTQKTRIMYICNLSYDQLQRYLKLLTSIGLLEVVEQSGKEHYHTSDEGKEFLKLFKRLEDFLLESKQKHKNEFKSSP